MGGCEVSEHGQGEEENRGGHGEEHKHKRQLVDTQLCDEKGREAEAQDNNTMYSTTIVQQEAIDI